MRIKILKKQTPEKRKEGSDMRREGWREAGFEKKKRKKEREKTT